MKTLPAILIGFILTSFITTTHAQGWAPIGAEWDYGYYEEYISTDVSWYHIEVEKDTIINTIPCRKLIQTNTDPGGEVQEKYLYTYEKNDSVFFYFSHTDGFHLVYDFTASVGDTLELSNYYNNPDFPVMVRLDSITTFNSNNGVALKKYHYSDPFNYILLYETVIEGIGNVDGMLPISVISIGYNTPIENFTSDFS